MFRIQEITGPERVDFGTVVIDTADRHGSFAFDTQIHGSEATAFGPRGRDGANRATCTVEDGVDSREAMQEAASLAFQAWAQQEEDL